MSIDTTRWITTRRRWSLTLGFLMTLNLSLVVLALAGYTNDEPGAASQNFAETTPPESNSATPAPIPKVEATDAVAVDVPVIEAAASDLEKAIQPSLLTPEPPEIASSPAPPITKIWDPIADPTAILVFNPPSNGGTVHFVFNDVVYTLHPGEYQTLSGCLDTQIVYHKGDDLVDEICDVAPGVFYFEVDSTGWELVVDAEDELEQLLSTCREVCLP